VEADVLVARRVYMAQGALDAGLVPPARDLTVLVDVLESTVLRRRRNGPRALLSLEARRTRRDEERCLRAASQAAYFSDDEREELGGIVPGPRLDLALPPAPSSAPLDDPVALFLGDRRWPPNAEGLARALALWPRVLAAAPGARLLVAGAPGPGEGAPLPEGVERLGFVDDLGEVWSRASVLLAPIPIGGGVRVKILEAARHGVPVVGSPAAIGSTPAYLPLRAAGSDDELVAEAAALLGDRAVRRERGEELYEANRALAARGFLEGQLAELLARPS
jgi:glycosyltransferase involved in cell wall biosynthesis